MELCFCLASRSPLETSVLTLYEGFCWSSVYFYIEELIGALFALYFSLCIEEFTSLESLQNLPEGDRFKAS